MGQFKDEGNAVFALAEECAEVIQTINKLFRFGGNWNEIPPGQSHTRWEQLQSEMTDVMYQWERVKAAVQFERELEAILRTDKRKEIAKFMEELRAQNKS